MRFNNGIFDAHVHTHGGCGVDEYLRNCVDHLSASGLDGENLICVRHGRAGCMTDSEALLLKALHPDKFTVFCDAAFDISEFDCSPEGLGRQVQAFIDAGADGLKMADGEAGPDTPLNSPLFDPMFDIAEKNSFPILYHVGGATYLPPRRKFQKNKHGGGLPPFLAYQPGRDDDTEEMYMIPTEVMDRKYAQIDNLLARHPNVRITFPHMYFLSDDLDRLAGVLDRYPLVNVDLTPCSEIYHNLSRNVKKSREFFVAYQDRLIFGTDNDTESDPLTEIRNIRHFLETDETFFVPKYGFDVTGIALPDDILRKIYRDNFLRICPPSPLNPKAAARFCENLYETVRGIEEMAEANKLEILEAAGRLKALA